MRKGGEVRTEIEELRRQLSAKDALLAARTAELAAARTGLIAKTLEAEKLKAQLARLRREKFGASSERDPVRTPMPWDGSANAGFTKARPWLPLNADWPTRNAVRMAEEPHSILTLYRRLLAMRRTHPALSMGSLTVLDAEGDVLAYERRHGAEQLIVALNLGTRTQHLRLPDWVSDGRPLLSTLADPAQPGHGAILLRGNEGVILTSD